MHHDLHRRQSRQALRPVEYTFTCTNPARLLDRLRDLRLLRTDAELAHLLGVTAPTLSKIRCGKSQISAAVVLRIHEVFRLPTSRLRAMLTDT